MRANEIEAAIVALKPGSGQVFDNQHMRTLEIVALAKRVAFRHGFTVKTSADHGGIRVEKTRSMTPSRVAKVMRKLKDGDLITFPFTPKMLATVERQGNAMERSYICKNKVYYRVDVVGEEIEVCCMHGKSLGDPRWKPNRIAIESLQVDL